MKDLIGKHLPKAIAFGVIMTIIAFFTGQTAFTFPPIWLDLLRLFFIYAAALLAVLVFFDWIRGKRKNG